MALTDFAKRMLNVGVANATAGADIAARINAGSGTLARQSAEALCIAAGNHAVGNGLKTKFENNTALADSEAWRIAVICGSHTAALAIKTEQAS